LLNKLASVTNERRFEDLGRLHRILPKPIRRVLNSQNARRIVEMVEATKLLGSREFGFKERFGGPRAVVA